MLSDPFLDWNQEAQEDWLTSGGSQGGLNDECFLNGVFQAKPFWEEADISRHSWFVPMGHWWKDPKAGLKVRITVVIVEETFSCSSLAEAGLGNDLELLLRQV